MLKKIRLKIKYFILKFEFLKIYFSPFKPPKIKLYIGKVSIGVPVFYPRKWVAFTKKDALIKAQKVIEDKKSIYYKKDLQSVSEKFIDYSKAVPKKIGFDFVPLGWKTKWSSTDYRFEYSPVWSFVFFKWQIALIFIAPEETHYWECWLSYINNTDKTKCTKGRIKEAKKIFPCVWFKYEDGKEQEVCYWDYVLKNKFCK